jgi:hypothetical protein
MIMFEYLAKAERDVAISAIYGALLRLFEAKLAGRTAPVTVEMSPGQLAGRNEIEKLIARILFDIVDAEKKDLASISPEQTSSYTAHLAKLASSRYSASKGVRSDAARFLNEIDPANAESDLAVR